MTTIKKAAKRLKKIFAGLTVTAILSSGVASAEQVKLTLDEAIALALKNNHAIEQSEADREVAKWAGLDVYLGRVVEAHWRQILSFTSGES